MAPERFGNNEITYRADVYALACVLDECLTGSPPYNAERLPALMAAHLTGPIPQPSRQNPSIPTAFDEAIACGMAKNPTDRYPSAGDLARAAHDALSTTDRHRADTLLEHSRQNAPPSTAPIPGTQPPPWTPGPITGSAPQTLAHPGRRHPDRHQPGGYQLSDEAAGSPTPLPPT